MIFLFLLLLLPSAFYSMTPYCDPEHQELAVEKNYQECQRGLQTYDEFIPGSIFMQMLMLHSKGPDLVKQIAAQDALWLNRSNRVLTVLVQMIRSHTCRIPAKSVANALDIFLTAAEQKGYSQFVNGITSISKDTILKASTETKNAECALVALQHNAK